MSANKKIYVNGGVAIYTPFFCYKNAGACYKEPPVGTEIMECDDEVDGYPCIKITTEKAPSIFNEYYAKTFFSTLHQWSDFLHKSIQQDYDEYQEKISGIMEVLDLLKVATDNQKHELIIMAYGNVFTALDTFVADTILTRITHDQNSFLECISCLKLKCEEKEELKKQIHRMWNENLLGDMEQKVIDNVLKTSFCDIDTIKKFYKKVFHVSIFDKEGKMRKYFHNRHLIIHRNGKRKDGTFIIDSAENIYTLIRDINTFVRQIMTEITQYKEKENKNCNPIYRSHNPYPLKTTSSNPSTENPPH